jgi:hypothetical protein
LGQSWQGLQYNAGSEFGLAQKTPCFMMFPYARQRAFILIGCLRGHCLLW